MHKRQPSNPAPSPQGPLTASRWHIAGLFGCWPLGILGCSRDVPPTQLLIENVNVVDPVNGLLEKRWC